MYDLAGCLILIVMVLLALALLKELWWLIVGIAVIFIVFYWGKRIYMLLANKQITKEQNFNPEMGEVYKVCPFCNSKVKVTEKTCPYCKRALN